jgi:hypothetical protein
MLPTLPSTLRDLAANDNISNNANTSNNASTSPAPITSKDTPTELSAEELSQDTEALLGMALETYGRFLMGNRRVAESVPVFERALGIAKKVLGGEHEQYLVLMNDCATAHIILQQYDKATTILNTAIAIGNKVKVSGVWVSLCGAFPGST